MSELNIRSTAWSEIIDYKFRVYTHIIHDVQNTHSYLVHWCYQKGLTLRDFCTTSDSAGTYFHFAKEEDATYFKLSHGF
jgi:hypothetical protein